MAGRERVWGGAEVGPAGGAGAGLGAALEHFEVQAGFLEAAEFGEGLVEVTPGGLLAAEELAEDVGAGGVVVKGIAEGGFGVVHLFEDGGIELGFDAGVAVLEPGGADDGLDQLGFDGSLGLVRGGGLRRAGRTRRGLRRG